MRIEECAKNLQRHGFEVFVTDDVAQAGAKLRQMITDFAPSVVSYGDSMTVQATGVIDELRQRKDLKFLDGFDSSMPREQRIEIRRAGLLADFFFTGVNAVGEDGTLHWLDMIGNRIAPVAFGPRKVVLLVGQNKIVDNREAAVKRIRTIAAPANVARHPGFKTPCMTTGVCADCNSPQRICNSWLSIDRCYPKQRITVILIRQDLGL